jgi:nitrate reductase alpha subunit
MLLTPRCGGYAALAWGYDYCAPTGLFAATPLVMGGVVLFAPRCGGYAALAWGYDYCAPTGLLAATPLV